MNFIKTLLITLLFSGSFSSCNNQKEEEKKIFKCLDVILSVDYKDLKILEAETKSGDTEKKGPYFDIAKFVNSYSTIYYEMIKNDTTDLINNANEIYIRYITSIDSAFEKNRMCFMPESINGFLQKYPKQKQVKNKIELAYELINANHSCTNLIMHSVYAPYCGFPAFKYEIDTTNCHSDSITINVIKLGNNEFYEDRNLNYIEIKTNHKTQQFPFEKLKKSIMKIRLHKKDINNFKLYSKLYRINADNLWDSATTDITSRKIK